MLIVDEKAIRSPPRVKSSVSLITTDLFTTIVFPSFFFSILLGQSSPKIPPLRLIISIHPAKKGTRDKRKTGEKGSGSLEALDDLTHFAPHAPFFLFFSSFFSCFFYTYIESRGISRSRICKISARLSFSREDAEKVELEDGTG